MFTLSSPVTGAAQTGLTTPSYNLATDSPPTSAGKQYAVSSLGGTQAGVDTASSPTRPFTITLSRPQVLRGLPTINPQTGLLGQVPKNEYRINVRKGVTPLAGQQAQIATCNLVISVPAGSELADAPNVRAMLSLLIGSLNQISLEIGNTAVTGVI